MQYNNDFDYSFGYYDGYSETEEERRKREQELANTAIQTQEVKTYADGTVERTTKEEMPGEFAPAVQPVAVQPVQQQPVQQPVAPVRPDTYQRMIQAESGGRDFNAQGQPLTSPKGAMFAAQVMPATAASPGFGVRPAAAQTAEEYNRVGQDYYNAMLQRYGGNEQAAAAAYNAGPGRVDRNMQANGGMLNVSQLPQETQQYLQKVLPQQAAPAPQTAAPADRQTRVQQQMAIVTGQVGEQQNTQKYIDAYQGAQDDPMRLLQLRNDESAPKFIRERAAEQAFALMNKEVQQKTSQQQAQELIQAAGSGDRRASNTIARELQNQKGSYLKMILLSAISPELAGEEAVKLGYGNRWMTTTDADGKAALIQVSAKGLPLKGYTADGNEIDTNELVRYAAGGKRELDIVGGTFVNDKTGEVGRMVTDKRTGKTQVQTDTGLKPMTGFRPQSSTGTLADQRDRMIYELNLKLKGKTYEEAMIILRPYNQALAGANQPIISPGELNITPPQIGGGTAGTAGTAGTPAAATTQAPPQGAGAAVTAVPPTAMPPQGAAAAAPAAGTGLGGRPTLSQLEAAQTAAKEEAQEVGQDIGKLRTNIGKAEANADYLLTKITEVVNHPGFETSVGAQGPAYLFGLRDKPLPTALGGGDARNFENRMREIAGQSFLQAIESLRGMGALSNAEGVTATRAIQRMGYVDDKGNLVITATEDEFRSAAKDFQEVIQRGIDRSRVKLGREPKYGTKPASETANETVMSPADRAKAELERRRKEKK